MEIIQLRKKIILIIDNMAAFVLEEAELLLLLNCWLLVKFSSDESDFCGPKIYLLKDNFLLMCRFKIYAPEAPFFTYF